MSWIFYHWLKTFRISSQWSFLVKRSSLMETRAARKNRLSKLRTFTWPLSRNSLKILNHHLKTQSQLVIWWSFAALTIKLPLLCKLSTRWARRASSALWVSLLAEVVVNRLRSVSQLPPLSFTDSAISLWLRLVPKTWALFLSSCLKPSTLWITKSTLTMRSCNQRTLSSTTPSFVWISSEITDRRSSTFNPKITHSFLKPSWWLLMRLLQFQSLLSSNCWDHTCWSFPQLFKATKEQAVVSHWSCSNHCVNKTNNVSSTRKLARVQAVTSVL